MAQDMQPDQTFHRLAVATLGIAVVIRNQPAQIAHVALLARDLSPGDELTNFGLGESAGASRPSSPVPEPPRPMTGHRIELSWPSEYLRYP